MIKLAIIILLMVLLVSNIALHIYNTLYPPCDTIEDYFKSARKLPYKAPAIHSVHNDILHTYNAVDMKYAGLQGATASKESQESQEESFDENEDMSSSTFYQAIDHIFKPKYQDQDTTEKINSSFNGEQVAAFEVELEGVRVGNKQTRKGQSTAIAIQSSMRDGYSNRNNNNEF